MLQYLVTKNHSFSDGNKRIARYLEYYLGRSEEMVKDSAGKVVYYTEGAMKSKPKKKVTHLRKQESQLFYLIAKLTSPMERQ